MQTTPGRPELAPFGTTFGEVMAVARWDERGWSQPALAPVAPIQLHPAAHTLHYGSSCFEGLKAHRGVDGTVRVFRPDRHVARIQSSAERLWLPVPPAELAMGMIVDTVEANLDLVPQPPGSLYLRPTLVGTAPNIGAAGSPTSEAIFYILSSPVGDYFGGGVKPLRIAVETDRRRTTSHFGAVKTGANYAMALGPTMEAKRKHDAAQVIFAPGGVVQETGASNVLLIDEHRIVTPPLDGSVLEGVTRSSVLTLAEEKGMRIEDRPVALDELVSWCRDGEIALSGTAAVLAPVGTLVVDGRDVVVGEGEAGRQTLELREALIEYQTGGVRDVHGWTVAVG